MRTRRRACLSTAAAVLAVTTTVAGASDAKARAVRVVGSLHASSDAVPDEALCDADGGDYAVGPTEAPESGTSTLRGTFDGTGRFCGHTTAGVGPGGAIPFVETDTFTGTVHGCGTGTVVYHVSGYIGGQLDPSRQGLPTEEDWQIVPGSGTGGLRGIRSGGGHDSGQINLDSSIDTEFSGRLTCVPDRSTPRAAPGYAVPVSGTWAVTGCVPTSVPTSPAFPLALTGDCTGGASGSWTGLTVDRTTATMDQDLSLRSRDDITLYGRADDGTCGSLHVRQIVTVAGDTSELKGVATIVGGTGDWAGSTGSYTTTGILNGGIGEGTYAGAWRRPGAPKPVQTADCRPGLLPPGELAPAVP